MFFGYFLYWVFSPEARYARLDLAIYAPVARQFHFDLATFDLPVSKLVIFGPAARLFCIDLAID